MSQSFGRRAQTPAPKALPPLPAKFSRPGAPPAKAEIETAAPSVDAELREWKKTRGRSFPIKPLALMASLCFGIGSFALPKEINDEVQWPLYALSAASLYVVFRRKRENR